MTPENPAGLRLHDDQMTWQAAYLDLLGSWTALCDMAGVEGDSAPSEVIQALRAALAAAEPGLDVRPEVIAWFHESDEICEHDYDPPSCVISADALLESFTVEPRLYEQRDGTWSFQRHHFRRLDLAADLAADEPGLDMETAKSIRRLFEHSGGGRYSERYILERIDSWIAARLTGQEGT